MNILEYAKRDPNTGMLLCGNYQSDPELVEKYRKAETIEVPPFNTFWAQLD